MSAPDRKLIVALDEGTTNTKAFLVDEAGRIIKEASRPVSIVYPQPAWVEQDAGEIWQTSLAALAQVLEGVPAGQLAGLAITNQRESILAWERATGHPLGPCITWQCHRSAAFCAELRQRGLTPTIYRLTGLTVDPMFSASKARWLLDNIPDGPRRAQAGEICLGTVDAWLLWNLTGGTAHACDVTNASRTQLFNLQTLAWDDAQKARPAQIVTIAMALIRIHSSLLPWARRSFRLERPGHQLFHGLLRRFAAVEDLVDLFGDGHLHAEGPGDPPGGHGRMDALGDHPHPGQDLAEGPALAELVTDPMVAAQFARAGQDEIADAG